MPLGPPDTPAIVMFTLTVDIENHLYGFEDIHQTISLGKFHENLTLLGGGGGGGDSLFESTESLPLKLNQIHQVRLNVYETLQGGSADKYLQKHGRNF